MTTYEKCQEIRRVIATRTGEIVANNKLTDSESLQQIKEIFVILNRKFGRIDIQILTEAQMDDLGFDRIPGWSLELRFIPSWLAAFLPVVLECEDIDGNILEINTSEILGDHVGGCLPYGIRSINTWHHNTYEYN